MSRQLGDLLRKVERLRSKLDELEQALGRRVVEGSAGGGMVRVKINGRLEVLGLHIDPQAMEDHQLLEDLVVAALSGALREVRRALMEELGGMARDLLPRIPGLF